MKIKFLKTVMKLNECPEATKPEVVLIGRSNAGKSSLINALAESKVAYVSSSPGRTVLLNFYDVGAKYRFVDSPGYGFSRSLQKKEGDEVIERYLTSRGVLKGMVLVMDSRRIWDDEEEVVRDLAKSIQKPLILVLTKADKLNRSELEKKRREIAAEVPEIPLFFTSSLKKTGVLEFEKFVFENWIQKTLQPNS